MCFHFQDTLLSLTRDRKRAQMEDDTFGASNEIYTHTHTQTQTHTHEGDLHCLFRKRAKTPKYCSVMDTILSRLQHSKWW